MVFVFIKLNRAEIACVRAIASATRSLELFLSQAQRSPQLCILALPPDMGFSELATFMGEHFAKVCVCSSEHDAWEGW